MHSRGILFPHAWLRKNLQFAPSKATKLLNGKQKSLNLEDMSYLCMLLCCTPNDLVYWQETPRLGIDKQHPLSQLEAPPRLSDWKKILRQIPASKAQEIFNKVVEEMEGKK